MVSAAPGHHFYRMITVGCLLSPFLGDVSILSWVSYGCHIAGFANLTRAFEFCRMRFEVKLLKVIR